MWHIDRDYLSEPGEESRVGMDSGLDRWATSMKRPKIRFRLLDDDKIVYYGGWLHDDRDCMNQSDALAFGMHDAGCTEIQVKREGKWVTEIG